jgi:hypothetical protein
MSNANRRRLVEHLLEVTKDKPVERQLRESWLAELARYRLTNNDSKDAVKASIAERHEPSR